MRDGFLPAAALCAALGLLLGFAPRRALPAALLVLVGAATASAFLTPPWGWRGGVLLACWTGALLTAAAVHLPAGARSTRTMVLASGLAGLLVGAAVGVTDRPLDLIKALSSVLLCLPATALAARGHPLPLKIVASWLAAVAVLSAGLTVVRGPNAGADHVE